ncbi:MAG TPA: hypothetical protein VEB22_14470 [Phycisphaerales bacterium]|nr:hypothetical protein [Phycisphaerales bacterium]
MGEDEVVIGVICSVAATVGWSVSFYRCLAVHRAVAAGGARRALLSTAPLLAATVILAVLLTASAHDVRGDIRYLWMYTAVGMAVVRICLSLPSPATLDAARTAVEGRNSPAAWSVLAATAGYSLAFAGANVGDGPGWYVVVFSAALSCGTLYLFHSALEVAAHLPSRVASDRSACAAWRLAALLVAAGAVCGRAACGNWVSASATTADFIGIAWVLAIPLAIEAALARIGPPRPEDTLGRFVAFLAAWAYLSTTFAYLASLGPWS